MYLYLIDLFCCRSSSHSCFGCGGPERSCWLCHRLYHDHCILSIYGHGTGRVLSFIRMRCGTGHGTGIVRFFVLFWLGAGCGTQMELFLVLIWHGTWYGTGMVLTFVLFQL